MGWRAEGLRPAWVSPGQSSPWQAALLAASILTSGFLLTQAQDIEVTVKPSQTLLQGQDATLTPGRTADFILCNWYRGAQAEASRILTYAPSLPNQQNGPGFTGRETAGPGCSLHIQSVTLSDSGTYTVSKALKNLSLETGRVQIEVIAGPPSSLGVGAILGIVLGSLAVATLAGTLLFCFFRARSPKDTSSKQMNPTSPVYENTRPSAQVVPENSSDVNRTYEELQHGRQSVYDQLKW